jgi:hypothetical protein
LADKELNCLFLHGLFDLMGSLTIAYVRPSSDYTSLFFLAKGAESGARSSLIFLYGWGHVIKPKGKASKSRVQEGTEASRWQIVQLIEKVQALEKRRRRGLLADEAIPMGRPYLNFRKICIKPHLTFEGTGGTGKRVLDEFVQTPIKAG